MLVYDGDCGFCTRCARWVVESRARDVEVVPWQNLDLPAVGLNEQQVRTAAYWLDDGTTDHGEGAIARSLMACSRGYAVIGRAAGPRRTTGGGRRLPDRRPESRASVATVAPVPGRGAPGRKCGRLLAASGGAAAR